MWQVAYLPLQIHLSEKHMTLKGFYVSDDLFFLSSSLTFPNEQLLHFIRMKSTFIFSQASDYFLLNRWSLLSDHFILLFLQRQLVKILHFASIPKLSLAFTPPLVGEESQQKGAWRSWQQSCLRNNSLTLAPDRCWVASQPLLSGDPRAPLQRKPRD